MCCPFTPWLSRSFGGKSLVSLVFHARFSTLAFPATRLAQMQPKNSCTALRCRVCVRNKIIACEKLRVWELLQRAFAAAASASSSNKNNSRHFVVVYEQLWGAECPRRVSTVASCLARFVFREVRQQQQQQQHVLASLLACARYSAYAAASVDVSVARSTQCGRCQRRQQTKQLVGNRCLSKMPVALLLGFSPFSSLYLLLSLLLFCSPWTLPLSPFVAPLAKSVLHVIYSYFCINTSIHYA